jgi:predicted 2-oxoglutarate/Fe(II)-dependent dioxygenase YbiX
MTDIPHYDPFVREGFLDPDACTTTRAEMGRQLGDPATITRSDGVTLISERVRRASRIRVPDSLYASMSARIEALLPEISEHFGVPLQGAQPLQFMMYRKGDFILPHADTCTDPRVSTTLRARRVTVIVFLNEPDSRASPESYQGGDLRLFDPEGRTRSGTCRWTFPARTGTLLAFPSTMTHEVTRLYGGARFTIVTWLT